MIELKECNWATFIADTTQSDNRSSKPLFRGHKNHEWNLLTTLERINRGDKTLSRYYRSIQIAKNSLECCTEQKWGIPEKLTEEQLQPDILFSGFYTLPAVEFMIYLRHHGFPSPLLDWSQSPYVASFFAYADADLKDKYCSIYKYVQFSKDGKGGSSRLDDPEILSIGPNIATHKRHFMQQSQYTYCVKKSDSDLIFSSHEETKELDGRFGDDIVKYILPISERKQVLSELRKMNISAYTLFGDEGSLIHTLARDQYVL